MKPCPRCNHEVQEDQTECPECGVVFAKWNAAHSSSPAPVLPPVPASGKFTPRHKKYLGLALVILSGVLFILGAGIKVPTIYGIGWLLSGIGLALYASGSGRSWAWGSLALWPFVGHLIGLLVFAKDKNKKERTLFIDLIVVAIVVGMAIAMSAMQDFHYKERMVYSKIYGIDPILPVLEEYYKKNGRFPVSTTAISLTRSMTGTLDKGTDVWTSIGLALRSEHYLGNELVDYTSDATGSTMTLRLTLSNFHKDSIDGKIISVTPSPEKETAISWVYSCSSGIDPIASKYFMC